MTFKYNLIILFTLMFLIGTCSAYGQAVVDKELYYPSPSAEEYYVVKPGDYLSKIAARLYGSEDRYKEILQLNPWITDANTLEPGWKLLVTGARVDPSTYRDFVKKDLIKKVFAIRRLKYESKSRLLEAAVRYQYFLKQYDIEGASPHSFISQLNGFSTVLYKLELYDFVESIMEITKDNQWVDVIYLMAALGWQESYFRNQTGKAGEKGYWQWKISSAQLLRPDLAPATLAFLLEFDTKFSAKITYDHLCDLFNQNKTWRRSLARYNGTGEASFVYASGVIKKFHALKRMRVK